MDFLILNLILKSIVKFGFLKYICLVCMMLRLVNGFQNAVRSGQIAARKYPFPSVLLRSVSSIIPLQTGEFPRRGITSTFENLKKKKLSKIRQHVNPLSLSYQKLSDLSPTWFHEAYSRPFQPIHIDIGCAKGGWPIALSLAHPELNVLGLEIRRRMVEYCRDRRDELNKTESNLWFLSSNANVDLEQILQSLTSNSSTTTSELYPIPIQMITVHFADPHFKKRMKKRRVFNPILLDCITRYTQPNYTQLFIQTDIKDLAYDMINNILAYREYYHMHETYSLEELDKNPSPFLTIPTEREEATISKGGSVYRFLVRRNDKPYVGKTAEELKELQRLWGKDKETKYINYLKTSSAQLKDERLAKDYDRVENEKDTKKVDDNSDESDSSDSDIEADDRSDSEGEDDD
jgi:tRNA (guanine-N7-)-methyltransferase